MATKSKKTKPTYPIEQKGNHLTVITHENGKTELIWDDDALLEEVRAATSKVEPYPNSKQWKVVFNK